MPCIHTGVPTPAQTELLGGERDRLDAVIIAASDAVTSGTNASGSANAGAAS